MSDISETSLPTQTVWAGEDDRDFWQHATQVPIVSSASFGYANLDEWLAVARGQAPGHNYSRNTNPTVEVLERKIAVLEGAERAIAFASGMAAVSNTLLALLEPGDRVVSIKDTYGGTNRMFTEFLPRLNVDVTLCDTSDHDAIEAEIARGCRVVYLETPTNPTLKVLDIARLAGAARKAGAISVVDNTFATPVNTRPLGLGADLVVHSATKCLGGHEDVLGGLLCGGHDLVDRVYRYREITGAALSAESAYLLIRGMKTLALRIERQNASALTLARFLDGHRAVEAVFYPGLARHPGHGVAARQMTGFGGILSFSLRGGFEAVRRFLPRLRLAHCAPSLGGVQTFVGPPATTSHVECTPAERAAMGIPESLLRYSVGIEAVEDLRNDLDRALA